MVVPSLHRAIRPVADVKAWRDLASIMSKIGPDIVHTHSSKAGILGRLAARSAEVAKVVHTIHGMSFNRTQPRVVRMVYCWAERYCGRFTDRIISVADAMTEQAVAARLAPADRFVTVYSGMRTEWYSPKDYDGDAVRRGWGFGDNAIVVCTVARLFRNKGYEQLIPAMVGALEREPRLRFVWVGDGAQRRDYESQLERLGIRSYVHLTGLLEPAQVPEILSGADMLVHTSQWEGLPRTAVQALLMECPVISFDIDGAPEVVLPDQTGMLVGLNDIEGLTEAILSLASDAELRRRMGKAGRELCRQRFDHEVMVDGIERIYGELCEG
jgi:glycosyltransferase involved in cell wall biosynthesis